MELFDNGHNRGILYFEQDVSPEEIEASDENILSDEILPACHSLFSEVHIDLPECTGERPASHKLGRYGEGKCIWQDLKLTSYEMMSMIRVGRGLQTDGNRVLVASHSKLPLVMQV